MEEKTQKLCADLINACATIRRTLPNFKAAASDADRDAVSAELAARGVSRGDWQQLVLSAEQIESAFYEEPKPT